MKFLRILRQYFDEWLSIRRARYDLKHLCKNCEVLKNELALAHRMHEIAFNKLFEKTEVIDKEPVPVTPSKFRPWRVRQQELEREDRIQAEKLRKKKDEDLNINELEKEIVEGVK